MIGISHMQFSLHGAPDADLHDGMWAIHLGHSVSLNSEARYRSLIDNLPLITSMLTHVDYVVI